MMLETTRPEEIEKRSFEMITEILGPRTLDPRPEMIIKRAIHTSAEFDYADTLYFSENAVEILTEALENGADIVTDTMMAKSGINKKRLLELGGEAHCFMADEDVAAEAGNRNVTRATVCMERAVRVSKPVVIAVGNAPTALIRLKTLIEENQFRPAGIIAVPVGFVNVVESKELIMAMDVPCIVARGRKGGSNIAAAICNALIYSVQV
jgi:precorrin-8X/cobalt-precorrin-8 methylmutase